MLKLAIKLQENSQTSLTFVQSPSDISLHVTNSHRANPEELMEVAKGLTLHIWQMDALVDCQTGLWVRHVLG